MRRVAHGQLSFDAAPKAGKCSVDTASLKLSGTFARAATVDAKGEWPQLGHGEEVVVQVVEKVSGEVIAAAPGFVSVAFKDKSLDGRVTVVREQTVKL